MDSDSSPQVASPLKEEKKEELEISSDSSSVESKETTPSHEYSERSYIHPRVEPIKIPKDRHLESEYEPEMVSPTPNFKAHTVPLTPGHALIQEDPQDHIEPLYTAPPVLIQEGEESNADAESSDESISPPISSRSSISDAPPSVIHLTNDTLVQNDINESNASTIEPKEPTEADTSKDQLDVQNDHQIPNPNQKSREKIKIDPQEVAKDEEHLQINIRNENDQQVPTSSDIHLQDNSPKEGESSVVSVGTLGDSHLNIQVAEGKQVEILQQESSALSSPNPSSSETRKEEDCHFSIKTDPSQGHPEKVESSGKKPGENSGAEILTSNPTSPSPPIDSTPQTSVEIDTTLNLSSDSLVIGGQKDQEQGGKGDTVSSTYVTPATSPTPALVLPSSSTSSQSTTPNDPSTNSNVNQNTTPEIPKSPSSENRPSTPTSGRTGPRPSRVMDLKEEVEMERLRAERAASGGRRGAFYAPPVPNFRAKIGCKPDDVVADPPSGSTGAVLPVPAAKMKLRSRRILLGFADTVGKRPDMQDRWMCYSQGKDASSIDFFGVFDGHRGDSAAIMASEYMPQALLQAMKISKKPDEWLKQAFLQTHATMKAAGITTGTTATVGLYWKTTCYFANAGDSRVVHGRVIQGGTPIATRLTQDHKPERVDETLRITALGGEVQTSVSKEGKLVGRVNGVLSITRALGDFDLAPHIIPDPEITALDMSRKSPSADPENPDDSSAQVASSSNSSGNAGGLSPNHGNHKESMVSSASSSNVTASSNSASTSTSSSSTSSPDGGTPLSSSVSHPVVTATNNSTTINNNQNNNQNNNANASTSTNSTTTASASSNSLDTVSNSSNPPASLATATASSSNATHANPTSSLSINTATTTTTTTTPNTNTNTNTNTTTNTTTTIPNTNMNTNTNTDTDTTTNITSNTLDSTTLSPSTNQQSESPSATHATSNIPAPVSTSTSPPPTHVVTSSASSATKSPSPSKKRGSSGASKKTSKELNVHITQLVEPQQVPNQVDFLVIACDGLWDVVTDDEAVSIAAHILQNGQVEEAAKRLRNVAFARGSTDNITVLVVLLHPPSLSGSHSMKRSPSCNIL